MPALLETSPATRTLRLTPAGKLHLDGTSDTTALAQRFASDWREGWFFLAADKISANSSPLRFWKGIAERYLGRLCHLSPESDTPEVEPLTPAEFDQLVLSAPPMEGGEYLSTRMLSEMWEELHNWVRERLAGEGGLTPFLSTYAPKWNQVGRVCFHLAENKQDPDRPFAFLATYSMGFNSSGRLRHLPLRKALEQYAGANNRSALIKLLTPVDRAAGSLPWVEEMVETRRVYQALPWSTEQAYQFLTSADTLEASGLTVKLPNWWKARSRPQVSVTIGATKGGVGADALLDFEVEVALGGELLSSDELRSLLNGPDGLVMVKGQWVEVDKERLREALEHWEALERQGEVSFIEGMRLLAGAPSNLKISQDEEEEREWLSLQAGGALREILHGLREPAALPAESVHQLQATLRPYQQTGFSWLRFLTRLGLGSMPCRRHGLGQDDSGVGGSSKREARDRIEELRFWSYRLRSWATGRRRRSASPPLSTSFSLTPRKLPRRFWGAGRACLPIPISWLPPTPCFTGWSGCTRCPGIW